MSMEIITSRLNITQGKLLQAAVCRTSLDNGITVIGISCGYPACGWRFRYDIMSDMVNKVLKKEASRFRMIAKDPVLLVLIIVLIGGVSLFILYPLARVISTAFHDQGGRMTLGNFKSAFSFSNGYYVKALVNSLWLGAATAVAGTLIGYIFAYSLTRAQVRWNRFFNMMATIPIVSPPFIGALAIIMLFGRNGFITARVLGIQNANIYGWKGLLFAQIMTFFPVAYITLKGVLESINPTLEDAAMDLGGNRFKIFMKVTLPLSVPGIASSMLLLFVESLADFGNPLILAGAGFPVLSVQAYLEITGMNNLAKGSALAFVLLLPSITAFVLQKYWVSRKQYITVTGKPTQSSNQVVSPAMREILFSICCLVSAFVLMIYLDIIWGAFAKNWGNTHELTLGNFTRIFRVGTKAIRDTLVIAGISTPLTGLIGMMIAFLVVRKDFLGKHYLEFTSMLSFAVPGTVIGIGYILAFNAPPIYLTGTLTIIVLNFIFRYIPVGIESGVAVLSQIDGSIEEAAIDLGANTHKVFSKITLPLMVPAFFSSLIFAFVRSMTAISAAIFLVSARWKFMTVHIMSQVEAGFIGPAAAYSLVLVGIILAAIGIIKLVLKLKYHTSASLLS